MKSIKSGLLLLSVMLILAVARMGSDPPNIDPPEVML